METMEYYKLIRNQINLKKVQLVSVNCKSQDLEKDKVDLEIPIALKRNVQIETENMAVFTLKARIGSENTPFFFEAEFKGVCVVADEKVDLDKQHFEQYTYDQIVPLLLPYVRECLASMLARMGLPIFTLPTIDVLETLEANQKPDAEDQE